MDEKRYRELFSRYKPGQGFDEFKWTIERVEALKPQVIIEIGVKTGGSLKFWEQILPKGGVLIGIDPENFVLWDIKRSDRQIHFVQGKSQDPETVTKVAEILDGRRADFIFVDGDHRRALDDFVLYEPFLREGGGIAFHDFRNLGVFHLLWRNLPWKKEVTLLGESTAFAWKTEHVNLKELTRKSINREILSRTKYSWLAKTRSGKIIAEIDVETGKLNMLKHLNPKDIHVFRWVPLDPSLPNHTLFLNEGQELIAERTFKIRDGEIKIMYLCGWRSGNQVLRYVIDNYGNAFVEEKDL